MARENLLRNRINNEIRVPEVRLIDGESGENLGVVKTKDALEMADKRNLDLIEISPNAVPPIAKIMDFGKFQYEQSKKERANRAKTHQTETKSVQIKIATGENDLKMKAKRVSDWLAEGHRVKLELYLVGRAKYSEKEFKKERLERILGFITENFKIAEDLKPSPRGVSIILEKDAKKKTAE